MIGWRNWLALSAFLLLPGAAHSQVVRGIVRGTAEANPLPGVIVLLVGPGGTVVDRALTDEAGAFRLDGPGPGTYQLRTQRIGYRPVTTPPFVLRSLEQVTRQIELAGLPISLETVQVEARSVCRVFDSESGPAELWEQARAALIAAELTSSRALDATIVVFSRTLEPYSERVRQQAAYVRSGRSARVWTARSADSIRASGYVRRDPDGGTTFFAPDIPILASDAFVEDHCFRVVNATESALVGITFEPTRDRAGIPEIRGTVWLDRATAELRRMDFRYANLSRAHERGEAGGDMTFVRLRGGGWVISRWSIRMPVVERRVVPGLARVPGSVTSAEERVLETRVNGGELVTVVRRGDTLWVRPAMTFRGVVTDSARGTPVPGARLRLRGTSLSAASGAAGEFAMRDMLPGDYTIEVRTASLDSLGLTHQSVARFADTATVLRIRVPDGRALAVALCGRADGARAGIVMGRVRVPGDSMPPRGLSVRAEWTQYAVREVGGGVHVEQPTMRADARVEPTGAFRICGVPVNTALMIRAAAGDSLSAEASARIPADARVTSAELVLQPTVKRPR